MQAGAAPKEPPPFEDSFQTPVLDPGCRLPATSGSSDGDYQGGAPVVPFAGFGYDLIRVDHAVQRGKIPPLETGRVDGTTPSRQVAIPHESEEGREASWVVPANAKTSSIEAFRCIAAII